MAKKKIITRRRFVKGSLVATAAAFTDAFFIEPNLSSITEKTIALPYLPKALDGLKIIQLTDFHYTDNDDSLMSTVVEKVNALNPDLILLTGDYVNGLDPDISPLVEHLMKLKAKHGILASMGNHDGWAKPGSHFKTLFKPTDIELLINENTALSINNETLHIAATDFVWLGNPDPVATLKGIPENAPLITLVHEPDYFDTMIQHRDHHLQLSGHTHGGQCRVPFINYAPKKVKYGKKYIYDVYEQQDSTLFVSKGIGTTGIRVRFSCLPEIALITLNSA